MDSNIEDLKQEVSRLQSENAELRAQLDAQRGGVDIESVLARIQAKNKSDKAYRETMEATFDGIYRKQDDKPSDPQTPPRFF